MLISVSKTAGEGQPRWGSGVYFIDVGSSDWNTSYRNFMRKTNWRVAVAAGLVLGGGMMVAGGGQLRAAEGEKKANATAAGGQVKGKRTAEQIRAELDVHTKELRQALTSMMDLFDEEKRKTLAPKVLPPMRAIEAGFEEMMAVDPGVRGFVGPARMQYLAILSFLGDEGAAAKLQKMAESTNVDEATTARGAQLLARWWKHAKNAGEQGKVLEETRALARAQPQSDELAQVVMMMSQQQAANAELQKGAQQILLEEMKSESAKELGEQVKAEQKLAGLEGKPLTIEGVRLDGSTFSTADWKGKVILVDFWATWCGPCIAELPRVKKVYAENHGKGLEILGVSCDNDAGNLSEFLAKNKDMPWPQLFDKKAPGWHALATEYGISGIPTMFLIDKKGVVRSVKARENFEEMIPKLLGE